MNREPVYRETRVKSCLSCREIRDIELGILCIGGHVSSALKACTSNMVTTALQNGSKHRSN